MSDHRFHIAYAAHTSSCSFLLDGDGICRRVVMLPRGKRRESSRTAARCVGAQYVASLDGSAAGGLVEMPRVGAAMLFARVDEDGRVSLVRTGTVTSFESKVVDDPFIDSGSGAVQTSAPELHRARSSAPPAARTAPRTELRDPRELTVEAPTDYDDYDVADSTLRIHARPLAPSPPPPPSHPSHPSPARASHRDIADLATQEYQAAAEEYPFQPRSRTTARKSPSAGEPSQASRATLRNPHRDTLVDGDDEYGSLPPPVSAAARGMLPRDPQRAAVANGWDPEEPPRPPRPMSSDVQVTRRRRGT